jgi:hypothetical protein
MCVIFVLLYVESGLLRSPRRRTLWSSWSSMWTWRRTGSYARSASAPSGVSTTSFLFPTGGRTWTGGEVIFLFSFLHFPGVVVSCVKKLDSTVYLYFVILQREIFVVMMTWLCFVSGPALICIQIYLLDLGGKGFARFFLSKFRPISSTWVSFQ